MSHINDALKKAQKERNARYLTYGGTLTVSGKEKGVFRGRKIWWSFFIFILIVIALVSYASLDSRGRQTPVTSESQHKESTPPPQPEEIDNAKALYDSARLFHQSGRLQRAKRLYQETLRLDPSYIDALNNLGVIYIHEKNFVAAQRSFEKAIRLNPGYVDPHYNLACLCAMKGQVKESLTHLIKAVSLDREVREWARMDTDLKSLRSLPEFRVIVGDKVIRGAVEE